MVAEILLHFKKCNFKNKGSFCVLIENICSTLQCIPALNAKHTDSYKQNLFNIKYFIHAYKEQLYKYMNN